MRVDSCGDADGRARKIDRDEFAPAPLETVAHSGVDIDSGHIAGRTDPPALGGGGVREIDRCEPVSAEQKAMEYTVGIAIAPRDIATIVDPIRFGIGRARVIDRGEPAPGQLEAMGHGGDRIASSDIAALVD